MRYIIQHDADAMNLVELASWRAREDSNLEPSDP